MSLPLPILTRLISSLLLFLPTPLSATTAGTNTDCDLGPDALASYNMTRTCLASTTYPGRRCYYTYVPACASADSPLVYFIHGLTDCPKWSAEYDGWVEKATENCFVLVMPTGNSDPAVASEMCWSVPGLGNPGGFLQNNIVTAPCCCYLEGWFSAEDVLPETTDDLTFLRNIASVVVRDTTTNSGGRVTIDTKRIYMAGHSNGCIASLAMATHYSDMVAGVCCHAGVAVGDLPPKYDPTPIMTVHGELDMLVPYEKEVEEYEGYAMLSAVQTHAIFAEANGCQDRTETEYEESDQTYRILQSTNCTNGADVTLLTVPTAGHSPFKGYAGEEYDWDLEVTQIDTTQMAWDFCSAHSLQSAPSLPKNISVVPENISVMPDSGLSKKSAWICLLSFGVGAFFLL